MMLTTLMLAAALVADPNPQAEPPQKGWVVEERGYHYHRQAKPEGWIIELRGFTKHRKQAETPKRGIIQAPQAKPQFEPVEVEAIETFYVDDLPAFFNQLKNR